MLKDKTLISFSSYNQPHFLESLVQSFEQFNPGSPCELLILDNSSTNPQQLKLLEKYAKKHRIEIKPNFGRAQGGYQYAWQNNKDYKYYFFLHDDSMFIRDNWLKLAIDRTWTSSEYEGRDWGDNARWTLPIGKVGFQAYEWGNKYKYFRTNFNQIFHYMDPIAKILNIEIPNYQHINDDKILYTNECLQAVSHIWSIEDWKQKEINEDPQWMKIHQWFKDNGLHNTSPFAPVDRYGSNYNTFQTVCEFLNDINPMVNNFRTHCVIGNGYCQEESGWSNFRGNEFIAHWGDHVVFKRLALLFNTTEEIIRNRYKDKTFLKTCANVIKNETKYVER